MMIKHVNYKHLEYFRYVSMIFFGYLKITFDIIWPLFAMTVTCEYVHVQISTMLFYVDVLITQ